MRDLNNFKKIVFLYLVVGLIFGALPVNAQTANDENQQLIVLMQRLIVLLKQEVALLQEQLAVSQLAATARRNARASVVIADSDNRFEIEVVAPNEKSEVEQLEGYECDAAPKGTVIHSGNYEFVTIKNDQVVATSTLGQWSFGGPVFEDLTEVKLPKFNLDLLYLETYGSCNGNFLHFYRFNNDGLIAKVHFYGPKGENRDDDIFGGLTGGPSASADGLRIDYYDNSQGIGAYDDYAYSEGSFVLKQEGAPAITDQ